MPIASNFTSTNSSFVDLVTSLPTRSSEKENIPPLVDGRDRNTMDWNSETWKCKGKGKTKDSKGDKDTPTTTWSNETGTGGGQVEGGGVAEDEMESGEEEELPHVLTYKAFLNFSRNEEQRATLSEELKERGCGTICSILCLWWDACQLEQNSSNSRLWSQYSQAMALCLHDNIRGLQPLTFAPGKPLPIILLDNFAHQATALAHLANFSSSAVLDIAKVTDEQHH
jgi:hypothetical protein